MKNTCKLNHEKREIVMDRIFAKLAENTMSAEYAHLQQVRKDYPTYTVIQRQIKKNHNKESYKGLTYEFMETYILTHGKQETRITNLREFNEMRLIAECHSKAFRYPVIKSWFLENYPEVKNFGKNVVQKQDEADALIEEETIQDNITDLPTSEDVAKEA